MLAIGIDEIVRNKALVASAPEWFDAVHRDLDGAKPAERGVPQSCWTGRCGRCSLPPGRG
jgi:hypothetical protein